MFTIHHRTESYTELVDVTRGVQSAVSRSGIRDGLCVVTSPHTTAGVTLNENWDPDVQRDILQWLDQVTPKLPTFRHAEGNSDAHCKASLMGFSVTLPVVEGRLVLGRWQGLYLCEFDGPHQRTLHVTLVHG